MKLLFIGGTGNISTDCAALLHKHGHQISILSRGRTAVPAEYQAVRADRKSPQEMRAALEQARPDVVLNFIGYEISEVAADHQLLNGKVQQYIFISTATVYAKPPRALPITEQAPLGNAWWDYSQKKQVCEEWLQQQWNEHRFPVTIVRPSHTYSKLWIPNPISSSTYNFAARIESGKPVFVPDQGENPWTMTAASDFAVGLAGLVGNPKAIGEAIHITSDEVLTWNQIYSEISSALGVQSPEVLKIPTDRICDAAPSLIGNLKGDKSHPAIFDNSKIKGLVPEFQCRKPFRVGIRESVAWLHQHPEQQNLDPQLDALFDRVIDSWKTNASSC